ncbi:MAG: DUF1284 domain-containing protein [Oscillospiraceae bacterium]|nr:DUF1284 domain-containing protein [Oscillospiraceae bacterium]
MKLRPHHALCIGFFQGKGYSPEFTVHLAEVILRLSAENPEITLTCNCDCICEACPHRINGVCDAASKVLRYDSAVLQYCGLEEGNVLQWSELRQRAQQFAVPCLQEICGGCQWYAVCRSQTTSSR